jgi:hypothetical protein
MTKILVQLLLQLITSLPLQLRQQIYLALLQQQILLLDGIAIQLAMLLQQQLM